MVRPVKELKGFEKVSLEPGQTRTVRFTLTPRDLSYYDTHAAGWVSTSGTHRLYVGSSSADIRLQRALRWSAAALSTPPVRSVSLTR